MSFFLHAVCAQPFDSIVYHTRDEYSRFFSATVGILKVEGLVRARFVDDSTATKCISEMQRTFGTAF